MKKNKNNMEDNEHEDSVMMQLLSVSEDSLEYMNVSEMRIREMFDELMTKIRTAEEEGGLEIEVDKGLQHLKTVLDPVLGSQASIRAMQMAAKGVFSYSTGKISLETWNGFIERLITILSIICGDVFAGLIRDIPTTARVNP